MVEKPAPEVAPSTLAVAGRYVLTPDVFDHLEKGQKGVGGEIQPTDAIEKQTSPTKVLAYRYQGRRYDCGSKLGLLQASVDLGEHHLELDKELAEWFKHRESISHTDLLQASWLIY
jgi:UTP--glucose-1-phosphate uridylyltransferase